MVGNAQTRHCIFLSIHNQLRRIGIKSIRFECINVDLSQARGQLFLCKITECILFGLPGRNIASVQLTRTVEILIISLLLSQTDTYIIRISFTLVLNGKLQSETLSGINYLIIIGIRKLIHLDYQHGRFHRYRNRLLLLSYIFSLLQRLFVSSQPGRKSGIRSSVLNYLRKHFIFRFHIHILIYACQSLHIQFGRRIFLQYLQEKIFSVHQIARCALTYQCIFSIIGNGSPIVYDLRSTIEVGTCHTGHQFKTLGMKCIQAFVDIQCLHILSLPFQNAGLDRQYLIIIRIHSQNAVNRTNQLFHIIGGDMYIHQIIQEIE